MDQDIIEKYKSGITNEYRLVYFSEGKDDPFGDMPIAAQEIGSEVAIDLVGEVTMATAMDEEVSKILASYAGDDDDEDSVPSSSYFRSGFSSGGYGGFGSGPDGDPKVQLNEDEELAQYAVEPEKLTYECPMCMTEEERPGMCGECSSPLRIKIC